VLAGLEPVGAIPDVMHLPPGTLFSSLANLRKSLNSVLNFSFFITKDMKVDLGQNQLSGTLPILYVFLERAGCKIDSVDRVWLDKAGTLSTNKAATSGVKIVFFNPGGAPQTLYYFETNLANDGIKSQPGFIKFCDGLGTGRSLVKAASYLMHLGEFTMVRDFLLAHCSTIVEDDSGIPIKDFDKAKWTLRYFGNYSGPIDIFKQHNQPDPCRDLREKPSTGADFWLRLQLASRPVLSDPRHREIRRRRKYSNSPARHRTRTMKSILSLTILTCTFIALSAQARADAGRSRKICRRHAGQGCRAGRAHQGGVVDQLLRGTRQEMVEHG
jgi:hypothetical protein